MSKRKTTKEFIADGIKRFGKRYDYSEAEYVTAHTPIKIKCSKHGYLPKSVTPNKHLRRDGGCSACKAEKAQKRYAMPIEAFLEIANKLQPTLDFSTNKQFKNLHEKVDYICGECGEHRQMQGQDLLKGKGCGSAACVSKKIREATLLDINEVVSKAQGVHADGHYSYSRSIYTGMREKMNIYCNYCKLDYFQTPDAHINQAQGCPKCGDHIRYFGDYLHNILQKGIFIEGFLYVCQFYYDDESFFKIGITRQPVRHRYRTEKMVYDFELICALPIGMVEAYQQEQFILMNYAHYSYKPNHYFQGWTECLSVNPIELDQGLCNLVEYYQANI